MPCCLVSLVHDICPIVTECYGYLLDSNVVWEPDGTGQESSPVRSGQGEAPAFGSGAELGLM